MKKLPPIEKVYEAWSAIADGRVMMDTADKAMVTSSDHTKKYTVTWNDDTYSSDDNATFWQGYPGYPVIAVLMLQGKLPLDKDEAELWKEVNWTSINAAHKRDYAAAVTEVETERGINHDKALAAAQSVMNQLESLPIVIKRPRRGA